MLGELRQALRDGGLEGSFLVRDLATGEELGIDPDMEFPCASLVKVPLALATLERVRRGELDGATPIEVAPGRITTPGPTGISRFRHPARVAVDDLLYLSTCISDNIAADTLFSLTPPAQVGAIMEEFGVRGLAVRHTMHELVDTPVERFDAAEVHLAHALAIDAGTPGRGHRVPQLDNSRANTGTARAFVDLLQAIWRSRPDAQAPNRPPTAPETRRAVPPTTGTAAPPAPRPTTPPAPRTTTPPTAIPPEVAARVRELMANNLMRHRLFPDFASDVSKWFSKTGQLLNLRHEIGVVEHADGPTYAVAVLTESRVAAAIQPAADALMGQIARRLRDRLRADAGAGAGTGHHTERTS
ncbi:serine hydrolase [Streptomyces sp. NPDC002643]